MRGKKVRRNLLITTSALSGFFFTIIVIMMIFDFNHSTFKLNKLIKFIKVEDNYRQVAKYYNLDIKTTTDTITITINNDTTNDQMVGTLNNDILTYEIKKDDPNILLKGKLLYSVADSIGQFNGNGKGYVSSILGSLDYSKMSIKRNGIEIYSDGNNNIYKFKVTKKFQLGSIADVYFMPNDFAPFKDKLTNEEYVQTSKGNLIFYKINDSGKQIMYFAEPDNLTSRTYNSLISMCEIVYGTDATDVFKKGYKKLVSGTFGALKMSVNYIPTEDEVIYDKLLGNYKVLKVETI